MLNQMNDAEMSFSKDVQMGRILEITGIGYQMVDIKRDYADGESAFDLYTLDPNFSFIVYCAQKKTFESAGNREKYIRY